MLRIRLTYTPARLWHSPTSSRPFPARPPLRSIPLLHPLRLQRLRPPPRHPSKSSPRLGSSELTILLRAGTTITFGIWLNSNRPRKRGRPRSNARAASCLSRRPCTPQHHVDPNLRPLEPNHHPAPDPLRPLDDSARASGRNDILSYLSESIHRYIASDSTIREDSQGARGGQKSVLWRWRERGRVQRRRRGRRRCCC